MQVNNNYSPNFSGTFRIGASEAWAKKEVRNFFTSNRQFFRDIKEDGDMFIVLRDSADKRFLRFMQNKNLKDIEYYPTINTKSGLDDQHPEGLRKLLASGEHTVFNKLTQIAMRIKQTANRPKPQNAQEQLSKIINAMRLNIESPQLTLSKQMARVRDDVKKRTLYVIAPNESINYAFLKYDDPIKDSVRCTIDQNGNIIKQYSGIKDMFTFNKKFTKLKNLEINLLQ